MARSFYRIVRRDRPTRRDFLSNRAKRGEPRPDLPERLQVLWDGLSVHDSLEQARRQAREAPWLGTQIAVIVVPEGADGSIRWERTIPNNPGHHTLWGDPDDLLGCVERVVPVEEATRDHDL